jgi:hypothetical protein
LIIKSYKYAENQSRLFLHISWWVEGAFIGEANWSTNHKPDKQLSKPSIGFLLPNHHLLIMDR